MDLMFSIVVSNQSKIKPPRHEVTTRQKCPFGIGVRKGVLSHPIGQQSSGKEKTNMQNIYYLTHPSPWCESLLYSLLDRIDQ